MVFPRLKQGILRNQFRFSLIIRHGPYIEFKDKKVLDQIFEVDALKKDTITRVEGIDSFLLSL